MNDVLVVINVLLGNDIGLTQGRQDNQFSNLTSFTYSIPAKDIDNIYSLFTEISYY